MPAGVAFCGAVPDLWEGKDYIVSRTLSAVNGCTVMTGRRRVLDNGETGKPRFPDDQVEINSVL